MMNVLSINVEEYFHPTEVRTSPHDGWCSPEHFTRDRSGQYVRSRTPVAPHGTHVQNWIQGFEACGDIGRQAKYTSKHFQMEMLFLDRSLGDLIVRRLTDSRRGKKTQLPLADLLRESVYSRLAGYADVNDAERVSQDPTFRLIGSEKIWDCGAAGRSGTKPGKDGGRREVS